MKKFIKAILVVLTISIFNPFFSAKASAQSLDNNEEIETALQESVFYDVREEKFLIDEKKAKEQGLNEHQISNVKEFFNSLTPEGINQLIEMTNIENEIREIKAKLEQRAVFTTSALIAALKAIGSGVASAIAASIANYGLSKTCENDSWRDSIEMFDNYCESNDW